MLLCATRNRGERCDRVVAGKRHCALLVKARSVNHVRNKDFAYEGKNAIGVPVSYLTRGMTVK